MKTWYISIPPYTHFSDAGSAERVAKQKEHLAEAIETLGAKYVFYRKPAAVPVQ